MVNQNISPITNIQTTTADTATTAGLIDQIFFNGEDSYTKTVVLRGISAGPGASVTLQPIGYDNGILQHEIVIGIGAGGPGTVFDVDAVGISPMIVTGGPITTSGTFVVSIQPATETQNGYLSSTDKIKLDSQSGVNTGDQTITLIGDVSGSSPPSSNTVITTTLANTGVVPGTYVNSIITVDTKGRILSAANGNALIPGEINIGQNIGPGYDIFAQKVGVALQFKTVLPDSTNLVNIADFSDHLEFGLNFANLLTALDPYITGQTTIGENLGTSVNGAGIYAGTEQLDTIVTTASVVNPGASYAVDDTITVAGGIGIGAILTVTAVSGGMITAVSVTGPGSYTSAPTNPASQASTSGSGAGATFNLTFAPNAAALTFKRLIGDGNIIVTDVTPTINSIQVGVGPNIPLLNQPNLFTGQQTTVLVTLTNSGSGVVWNMNLGNVAVLYMTGNLTLVNPLNALAGGVYYLIVINDPTGTSNLSFGTSWYWPCGGMTPTLTQLPNAIDLFSFVALNNMVILGIETKNFQS
jgi:hypothetical protein